MDDSATNNLFNDPITGAGKNEDFLAAEVQRAPEGQRVEKPAVTEGKEKDHQASRQEKAKKIGRSRAEHPAADASDKARKEHRVKSELTDISDAGEAEKKLKDAVKGANEVRTFLTKLSETARNLREKGGDILLKQVLPGAALFTLAAVGLYVDRTGSGLAQVLASGVPEAFQGAFAAATNKENRLVSEFLEKRGMGKEEEDDAQAGDKGAESQLSTEAEGQGDKKRKIDPIQVADHVTAAALAAAGSIITGKFAPETQQFIGPAELALEAARAADHVAHKYVEGPALRIIKSIKDRRGTATEAQLHAAGVVEPVSENAKTESRLPKHIGRARRWVNASRSGGSSRPDDNRPPTGPANHRERRSELRAANRAAEKQKRKGKTDTTRGKSPAMAHSNN